MSFYASYPLAGLAGSNASVGLNGSPAPLSSTEIGAIDPGGDLVGLTTDASGNLNVAVASSVLPTGAATAANQVLEIASLTSIDGKLATLGQKTMAGSEPVVIASDQSAIPISAASLPLPTGASTAANQATEIASLASIDSKLGTLGQKTMAGSAPVVIASDQSTLPVSAASLPLPTGAATEATLSTLNGKLNTLGQKTMANSAPVVIASDQSTLPVSAASLPLPTGAATSALQTTGNTSLSSIDGKLANNYGAAAGALRTAAQVGNATGVADFNSGNTTAQTLRVVIVSDQPAIPVTGGGGGSGGSIAVNGSIAVSFTSGATSGTVYTAPANGYAILQYYTDDGAGGGVNATNVSIAGVLIGRYTGKASQSNIYVGPSQVVTYGNPSTANNLYFTGVEYINT